MSNDEFLDPTADQNEEGSGEFSQGFKKRLKTLLKEPENQRCSECWSKKHKPKYIAIFKVVPIEEEKLMGVFCCKRCREHHLALGENMCTIKSLKEPEKWNESDIEILEGSGNKVVNAIYLASMQGNHTEKHMGSLASKAFVESKYKNYLFFSEETYHEQMNLVAMLQFAKNMKPVERAAPTAEDKLRTALKKQKFMSVRGSGFGPENDDFALSEDEENGSPKDGGFVADFGAFELEEETNNDDIITNNQVRDSSTGLSGGSRHGLRDSTGLSGGSRHGGGSRRPTTMARGRSPAHALERGMSRKSLSPVRVGRFSEQQQQQTLLARPKMVQRATSEPVANNSSGGASRSRSPVRGLSRESPSRMLLGGDPNNTTTKLRGTSSSQDLRSRRSQSPNGRGMSRGMSPGRGRGLSRERSSRWLLGGSSGQSPSRGPSPSSGMKREKSIRSSGSRSLNRGEGSRKASSSSPPRQRRSGSPRRSNSHSPSRRTTPRVSSKSDLLDRSLDGGSDSSLSASAPGSLFDDDSVSETSLDTSESSQNGTGTKNRTREDVILRAVQARVEAKESKNAMLSTSLHRGGRDLPKPKLQSNATWSATTTSSSSSSPGPSSAVERRQMILDNVLGKEPGEGKSIPKLLQSQGKSNSKGKIRSSSRSRSRSSSPQRGSPPPSGVGRRQMMTMMIQDSANKMEPTSSKKISRSVSSGPTAPSAAVEKRQFILDEVMSEDPFKGL